MLVAGALVHDRYRIVRAIGRGGMGAVCEAVDTRFQTALAVKRVTIEGLRSDHASEREATLLAGLRRPTLPVVIDQSLDSAGRFLVMQLIEGGVLRGRRRSSPMRSSSVGSPRLALLMALAMLLGAPATSAAEAPPDRAGSQGGRVSSSRLCLVVLGARAGGPESAGAADLAGLAVAANVWARQRWGAVVELWPLLLWSVGGDPGHGSRVIPGLAAAGLLTFDVGSASSPFRVRVEAGVGPTWTPEPVPGRGSRWNFFNEEGVRLLLCLGDGSVASLGYRFVHVSNGRSSGAENPGLNLHAVVMGWTFR